MAFLNPHLISKLLTLRSSTPFLKSDSLNPNNLSKLWEVLIQQYKKFLINKHDLFWIKA